MKPLIEFVKTTLIGGLLFLIPVVVVMLLVQKALHLASSGIAPVAHLLPAQSVVGIAVAQVVAVCALLFVCFMAGLAIRTRTGALLNAQLEQVILRRVPGFTFVKNIAHGLAGLESGSELSVALAPMRSPARRITDITTASSPAKAAMRRVALAAMSATAA